MQAGTCCSPDSELAQYASQPFRSGERDDVGWDGRCRWEMGWGMTDGVDMDPKVKHTKHTVAESSIQGKRRDGQKYITLEQSRAGLVCTRTKSVWYDARKAWGRRSIANDAASWSSTGLLIYP